MAGGGRKITLVMSCPLFVRLSSFSYEERPVRRPHVSDCDHDHVDQRPDSEPSEAEQLPDALLPMAKVETVGAEAAKGYAGRNRKGLNGRYGTQ